MTAPTQCDHERVRARVAELYDELREEPFTEFGKRLVRAQIRKLESELEVLDALDALAEDDLDDADEMKLAEAFNADWSEP